MSYWMFNCQDISKKVSISLDQTLPFYDRMMITFHLWMCKYCRRFRSQLLLLRKVIRSEEISGDATQPLPTLPAEIKERIKQTMSKPSSDLI